MTSTTKASSTKASFTTPAFANAWVGRAAVVAAVLGISVLGNLRLHASEMPRSKPGVTDDPVPAATSIDTRVLRSLAIDGDADGVASNDGAPDDDGERLVPAIYAWDPDVRFVYYRHVSKWM